MSEVDEKSGPLVGPGYYKINRSFLRKSNHKPSSSFASREKRDCSLDRSPVPMDSSSSEDEIADDSTPGPGYYTENDNAFPKRPLTNKYGA